MSDSLHLFVYGTLKRGQCRERCWPHPPLSACEATIRAALYDLGPYPAIGSGNDLVLGELWEIAPERAQETLRVLDEIEGYAGRDDDLYVRRRVMCAVKEDDTVEAWTYYFADEAALRQYRRVHPGAEGYARWP